MPMTPQGFAERTETLRATLVEQGHRVHKALDQAFAAIFEHNDAKAKAVITFDDEIDRVDVELEKASVALLGDATRAGAELGEVQLRTVLTIVKANNELERIADGAVDLAEMLPALKVAGGSFPETFKVMANSVIGIMRDTNVSVARSDPNLANIVLQSQHAVTAFKDAVLRDCEEQIARGTMKVDFAFHLHEIASLCETMADHCTNIAEQVIYLTTGGIVRHTQTSWVPVTRPKA